MYDSSALIKKFHKDCVSLSREQSQDMQRRRDTNLERLKAGLKYAEKPSIAETINQGGNAMQTMTQPPENDQESRYDIDFGVVLEADDVRTPATTKEWVRNAIAQKATNLKSQPESKKKCVRVIYSEGYQCDFPVLKREPSGESYIYKIAIGEDWTETDPKGINKWFESQVKEKSPEPESDFQLRRIVRFIKYFAKVHAHRTKSKFPSGIVATALAIECYQPVEGRDDEAIYNTLKELSYRSEYLGVYANGVCVSEVSKDGDRIKRLAVAAKDAVNALDKLASSEDTISEDDVRKAWKKVFRHSFFDGDDAKKALNAVEGPTVLSSISASERAARAEVEAGRLNASGSQTKPWSR